MPHHAAPQPAAPTSPTVPDPLISLRILGPARRLDELPRLLAAAGFQLEDERLHMPAAAPMARGPSSPGKTLLLARKREDLSQRELSRRTGIPQRHLSEMENHKRPIGKEMARRLAVALRLDYRVLL